MDAVEITHPRAEVHVRALVGWAAEQETEVARAAASKWAMRLLAEVTSDLSVVRTQAVRSLWATGWSLADIHEALGISRARIHQIIEK